MASDRASPTPRNLLTSEIYLEHGTDRPLSAYGVASALCNLELMLSPAQSANSIPSGLGREYAITWKCGVGIPCYAPRAIKRPIEAASGKPQEVF